MTKWKRKIVGTNRWQKIMEWDITLIGENEETKVMSPNSR
jgi:hypothetical protein